MLSTCVCFLLISAVWVQVGSVEIKQSHGTEAAAQPKKSYEINVSFKSDTALTLDVKSGGKRAKRFKLKENDTDLLLAKMQIELTTWLTGKKINISQALIKPIKQVSYGHLVKTLDILRSHKVTNLGVIPGGGK